jgi:hypothetical protein
MPLSRSLFQEGIIIPPIKLIAAGQRNDAVFALIVRNSRTSDERSGDLAAQLACHHIAAARVAELVAKMGITAVSQGFDALIAYGEQRMRQSIHAIPDGVYAATEYLDDDGVDPHPLAIHVTVTISADSMHIDFAGSAPQCRGPLNAPQAVTESAVLYALRLLDGDDMPASAGVYRPLTWHIPVGSILNPLPPAAVAGGNVETSQRVVDAMLAALRSFSKRSNVIVLTEAHSNLADAAFITTIDRFLATLDDASKQWLQPDLLITVGHNIISRKIKAILRNGDTRHWHVDISGEGLDTVKKLSKVIPVTPTEFFERMNEGKTAQSLLQALTAYPGVRSLHRPANLEDLFLKLTGRQIREEG